MKDFLSKLGKELLVLDGAMGTMLQSKGLTIQEVPEIWNLTNPDAVLEIHRAYAQAGCDIISTNTFGANSLKLNDTGHSVGEVVTSAVALARRGADTTGALVALDIGPTGKLLAPMGDLDFEQAVNIFATTVKAGASAGADLILLETMSDTYEIKAAMLAAKENCDLPILVTVTLDEAGRLLTGGDLLTAVSLIEGLGAVALGLNCGTGPEQMQVMLAELSRHSSLPIMITPNAGLPQVVNGRTTFNIAPSDFASQMAAIAKGGAHIIGGCCGTTPEHMAAVVKACKGIVLAPPTKKSLTVVSSYGKSVVFEDKTVIIGERINPTGKPRLKQALRENDMSYIFAEGLNQIEHGAEILDVNTGLPEIDEAQVLKNAVVGLQSITDTPLQIDTSDPIAAENALRIYNGKPLLNSVNGKAESLASILPLVKKYGAAVVALTLDDDGIPDTAQGRMEIAERIIAAAVQHGIDRKDIIIDPLAMTVSTGENNAKITLETIERVRKELGTHTVLGVSNISFGLPEREKISATFFTLAMNRGLSAGIINPLSDAMMDAFAAYNTLTAKDENCAAYITRFAKSGEPSKTIAPTTGSDLTLHDAIVKGLRSEAGQLATTMLENTEPLVIISEHLIPALNKVGENFELGKIFLPQLLMSAEAAKSAFEAIKVSLSKQGESQVRRGKIVLATVKGDVHDIGKNIVKVLLENYNFEVIDLGKNVEPNVIVDTVLRENVRLVGLSALMTTTVVYMEETIAMLRKKAPDCLVMVGGAVLTQEYADRIGADFYSKDAMGSVRYSERVFENEN